MSALTAAARPLTLLALVGQAPRVDVDPVDEPCELRRAMGELARAAQERVTRRASPAATLRGR